MGRWKAGARSEMERVCYSLTEVLYLVVAVLHEALPEAVPAAYGQCPALPPVLRFATWVGGDMDGNPNVGADTMRDTLQAQRAAVLKAYRSDVLSLRTVLTHSLSRVAVDREVLDMLEGNRQLLLGRADCRAQGVQGVRKSGVT